MYFTIWGTARNDKCDKKSDDINHQPWMTGNFMIPQETVEIKTFSKASLLIFRIETQ
jgi:hypothetical protein